MNFPTTDSPARCGEKEGRKVLLKRDHRCRREASNSFRGCVALPLRYGFNADGGRTFWKEAICIKFRLDNRYCVSHELGKVTTRSRLRTDPSRGQKQQEGEKNWLQTV